MDFVVFMTLPGLVILLTAVAFVDQLMLRAGRAGVLPWRGGRQGQITATGFEQLHATFTRQAERTRRAEVLVDAPGRGGRRCAATLEGRPGPRHRRDPDDPAP